MKALSLALFVLSLTLFVGLVVLTRDAGESWGIIQWVLVPMAQVFAVLSARFAAVVLCKGE